jgi:hypothetical protein
MAAGLILSAGLAGAAGFTSPAPFAAVSLFKDGPPARVTGGFGEDSCFACHFDGTENDGRGTFSVAGLPAGFVPSETYPLVLTLSRPGMAVAGFQLAVRHAGDGSAAGTLAVPPEEDGRVGLLHERHVPFAHHHSGGIDLAAPGTGRWMVFWTAPASGGRVLVHAAAVAGDGDDSQMGDHVYTVELETDRR